MEQRPEENKPQEPKNDVTQTPKEGGPTTSQAGPFGTLVVWTVIAGVVSIWFPLVAIGVALLGPLGAIAAAKSRLGRFGAIVAIPLVLFGFWIRYRAAGEAEDRKEAAMHRAANDAASAAQSPRLSAREIWANPEAQIGWIDDVRKNCAEYEAAPNEIKKSDIFNRNEKLLEGASADRIVGTLSTIATDQGGDELTLKVGVGQIKLQQGVAPFSQISRGTPIYEAASNMKEGQCVLISMKDFGAASVLERSKVCDLDYDVKFTQLAPCPSELLPPSVADAPRQEEASPPDTTTVAKAVATDWALKAWRCNMGDGIKFKFDLKPVGTKVAYSVNMMDADSEQGKMRIAKLQRGTMKGKSIGEYGDAKAEEIPFVDVWTDADSDMLRRFRLLRRASGVKMYGELDGEIGGNPIAECM